MGNFLDSSGLSRVWNKISQTFLSKGGGTMNNTNLVTNLNADLLDGYNADSFYRLIGTYGKGGGNYIKITRNTQYSAATFLVNIYQWGYVCSFVLSPNNTYIHYSSMSLVSGDAGSLTGFFKMYYSSSEGAVYLPLDNDYTVKLYGGTNETNHWVVSQTSTAPADLTEGSNYRYITGITSSMVTSALGYTPQNSSSSITFSGTDNYVAARFNTQSTAVIACQKYIEWWQSGDNAGWFRHCAGAWITSGGTSSHFVKGDGSLDSNTYLYSRDGYKSDSGWTSDSGNSATLGIHSVGDNSNTPADYGSLSVFGKYGSDYGYPQLFVSYSGGSAWIRSIWNYTEPYSWHQLAFLDSNVASADYATAAGSANTATTATSAGNADTVDGFHVTTDNTPWGKIPAITSSGWMEVGRHFEFHYDNTTGSDFSTALGCTGNYGNFVNLPSESGTLALTSQVLLLSGGTMSNTNTVTNLNADLLDGHHSSDFASSSILSPIKNIGINGAAGWRRIAKCQTSDMVRAITTFFLTIGGGSWSPNYAKYKVYGSWSRAYAYRLDVESNGSVFGACRTTYDSTYVYIEVYFNTSVSGASLVVPFTNSGITYEHSGNSGWTWNSGDLPDGGGTVTSLGADICNGWTTSGDVKCGSLISTAITTGGISCTGLSSSGSISASSTISTSGNISASGNITATGAITAGSASDLRLKENIREYNREEAKNTIMSLRPVRFRWNSLASSLYSQYSGEDLGFIAQDLESVLPEAIGTIFEEYKRLDYTKLITPLIAHTQDIEERLERVEKLISVPQSHSVANSLDSCAINKDVAQKIESELSECQDGEEEDENNTPLAYYMATTKHLLAEVERLREEIKRLK